ncbi:MAG TPA: DNA-3-methyladenine glycosylase I [Acidocella sp.]|jgi:DNA-3-methyladenine glycosylase I|nr:DNA-3-methyladenine glycosylase I [Acidocella sp.]
MSQTLPGPDGKPRCRWCVVAPDYLHYHDREWGFPVDDDRRLFEKLCLEGFQAGLSWRTILAKRENFRAAFKGFDPEAVAGFDAADAERLLQNSGIVRHRGKIEAAINNARRARELVAEAGSLASFVWSFEPPAGVKVKPQPLSVPPAAIALSKALKKRGWAFVGPTTVYAFMQAMGLVNDHAEGCAIREEVERARAAFRRPARLGRGAKTDA